MKYKTILFDLDGTLLDFGAAQREAFFETFGSLGIAADEAMLRRYDALNERLWRMLERGEIARPQLFIRRFRLFLEQEGIAGISPDEVQRRYMLALSGSHTLIDGALPLLHSLYGKCELCVITNGVSLTQRRRMRDSGIERYFSRLFISEEIGFEKPDPGYFAAVKAGCGIEDPSSALVVGDSPYADIYGGGAAGFDTCWYNPGGLDFNGRLPPTYIIGSLDRLPELL